MSILSWKPKEGWKPEPSKAGSLMRYCNVCGASGIADDVELERHVAWMHRGDSTPYPTDRVANQIRAERAAYIRSKSEEMRAMLKAARTLILGAREIAEQLAISRSINEWAYTFTSLPHDIESISDATEFARNVEQYAREVENGTEPLGDFGWMDGE